MPKGGNLLNPDKYFDSPMGNRRAYVSPLDPNSAAYMVRDGKVFISGRFKNEGDIFYYDNRSPSLQMQPLNKKAADAFEEMIKRLDELGHQAQEKFKRADRPYVHRDLLPQYQGIIDLARDPSRYYELVNYIQNRKSAPLLPVMGVSKGDEEAFRDISMDELYQATPAMFQEQGFKEVN